MIPSWSPRARSRPGRARPRRRRPRSTGAASTGPRGFESDRTRHRRAATADRAVVGGTTGDRRAPPGPVTAAGPGRAAGRRPRAPTGRPANAESRPTASPGTTGDPAAVAHPGRTTSPRGTRRPWTDGNRAATARQGTTRGPRPTGAPATARGLAGNARPRPARNSRLTAGPVTPTGLAAFPGARPTGGPAAAGAHEAGGANGDPAWTTGRRDTWSPGVSAGPEANADLEWTVTPAATAGLLPAHGSPGAAVGLGMIANPSKTRDRLVAGNPTAAGGLAATGVPGEADVPGEATGRRTGAGYRAGTGFLADTDPGADGGPAARDRDSSSGARLDSPVMPRSAHPASRRTRPLLRP
jgi:hypothetical protein